MQQRDVPDALARPNLDRLLIWDRLELLARAGLDLPLDLGDALLRLPLVSVHDLPAGALRQVAPYEDDHQAQHRTQQVGDPPPQVRRELVQDPEGRGSTDQCARPVGAVDGDVYASPVARRD